MKGGEYLSRGLLVRDDLDIIVLLIVGQHHGDTVPKRDILPGDVEALSVLARPDSADAGPDFLAGLVFAVIEEVGWGIWHGV